MTRTITRLGAMSLVAAGILFVLYPAVRPWHDESTMDGARAAMSADAWVAAHAFAMVGFVLLMLGFYAARRYVGAPALVMSGIGVGLILPYYGAEDFGLHAAARQPTVDILTVADATRNNPVAITMFGAGLILLAVGAVWAAVAVWRAAVLPRHSAVLLGLAFALFLPQFYTAPALRITHGVLVGIGCAWFALALWRARPAVVPSPPTAAVAA